MVTENFDYALVDKIVEGHGAQATAVIAILQEIQEHYRYLPREIFPYLSKKLGMPEARIYSVATFYEKRAFTASRLSMRIFPLIRRGSSSSRSATGRRATCAAPFRFSSGSARSSA